MSVKIYHNPRCSKSRQTLALLKENGIEPKIIEYLKTPPSIDEIRNLLEILGIEARQLMRTGEGIYKELGLKSENSESKLIQAMANNPKLIERPIVVNGKKAVIGRPPENVLKII